MDLFSTFTIGAVAGTFVMVIVYLYLYLVFRDRFMGLWAISWFILFWRLIFIDSGIVDWMHSDWGLLIFHCLLLSSALLIVWATYLFITEPMSRIWWLGASASFILSNLAILLQLPFFYKLFPVSLFCGVVCIWTGLAFIYSLRAEVLSKYILGYSYIFWGIHTLDMPFLITITWFAPWGYIIEGVLRLTVAVAGLLLYLERTRLNLAQKESQYRLLAENAVDIIYLYKVLPEPKVEYISPSVSAVTGYTPEDYYTDAKLMFNMIHSDDKPLFDEFLQNLPRLGVLPLTLRIVCKDQTISWVEQNVVPIFDQTGKLLSLEGIIRDVTARKNLEQSMSRLDRMNMIGEMAANVAHEIRNPLTTVRGYLQIMGNRQEFTAYKDRFELMIGELDRTNAIICEYLSLAKNKLVELKHHDLNTSITSLLPLLEADAIATKANVTLSLDNIPQIYLDENEIRQLLLNLVRNGLESMPSGGTLHISTYVEKEQVVLSVADQGCGIWVIVMFLTWPFQALALYYRREFMYKRITELTNMIKKEKIPVLGIKVWYGDAFMWSKLLAQKVREACPDTIIIAGGPQVKVYGEYMLKDDIFDIVIMGPGEEALEAILNLRRKFQDKKECLLVFNRDVSKSKLIKMGTYDIEFANPKKFVTPLYRAVDLKGKIYFHTLVDGFGCSWNQCNFCSHTRQNDKYHPRPVKEIVDEIEVMTEQGISFFRFSSSETPIEHGRRIAEEIIKRNLNINFSMFARAVTVTPATYGAYCLMIKAGLRAIFMGGETGHDIINEKVMNKGIRSKDVVDTINCIKLAAADAGSNCRIGLSLIYPCPVIEGIKLSDVFQEDMRLIQEANPDTVIVNPPVIFPETKWMKKAEEFGFSAEPNFVSNFMKYEYSIYKPMELWDELGYSLQGMSGTELLKETSRLRKEVVKLGIPTDISDEYLMMTEAIGYRSRLDLLQFKSKSLQDIMSGSTNYMGGLIEKINQKSREMARQSRVRN